MAAVAELFEGDSDDPEEQRRRIEARQAAENVGVLLALAILLTERVLRRRDSQAEEKELRSRQAEQEPNSPAADSFQPEEAEFSQAEEPLEDWTFFDL